MVLNSTSGSVYLPLKSLIQLSGFPTTERSILMFMTKNFQRRLGMTRMSYKYRIAFFFLLALTAIIPPAAKTTATYTAPAEIQRNFQIIQGEVTKYSSEPGQTDDSPFITANGDHVGPGTIACPSRFAFGTKIEIDGKTYFCNDRMAKRYRDGNYFDIWVDDTEEAIRFGRQKLDVFILN